MNDDTSIIILATKKQLLLNYYKIKSFERFTRKHYCIKEMLIVRYENNEKRMLIKALRQAKNNNIVLIEPEIYTRPRQILFQIKKLRKCDLVLPNRFDKRSKTDIKDKGLETKNKLRNLLPKMFWNIKYGDPINPNKAFKKNCLRGIINNCKNKQQYWAEIIICAEKKGLRITEVPTHYIMREKGEGIDLFTDIKEMIYKKE